MSVPFFSCHPDFHGLHHLACAHDHSGGSFGRNILHYIECCRHDEAVLVAAFGRCMAVFRYRKTFRALFTVFFCLPYLGFPTEAGFGRWT